MLILCYHIKYLHHPKMWDVVKHHDVGRITNTWHSTTSVRRFITIHHCNEIMNQIAYFLAPTNQMRGVQMLSLGNIKGWCKCNDQFWESHAKTSLRFPLVYRNKLYPPPTFQSKKMQQVEPKEKAYDFIQGHSRHPGEWKRFVRAEGV